VSRVVGVGELAGAVDQILEEYGNQALSAIMKAAPRAARKARTALKETSPVGSHSRHYNAGWTVQTQGARSGLGIRVVVHNKTKPGLTHLLEHGHVLRNGGRASARPHIAAVNDAAQKQFIEEVEKALRKG
jgi:hypothetical protein